MTSPPGTTEHVEVARAESERGEVVLRRRTRGDAPADGPESPVLEVRVNGVFVMDTLETSSERALATTALGQLEYPRDVVVGGLGLGFTAREILGDPRVEQVVVVEVEEALVGWMRDGTVPHGPAFLADDRLRIVTADIRVAMAEASPASYDLVVLDVDNGPGFLVYDHNAAVYQRAFLDTVHRTLRPGGALVVWSASESPSLAHELAAVFGEVRPVPCEVVLQGREERYWLYVALR